MTEIEETGESSPEVIAKTLFDNRLVVGATVWCAKGERCKVGSREHTTTDYGFVFGFERPLTQEESANFGPSSPYLKVLKGNARLKSGRRKIDELHRDKYFAYWYHYPNHADKPKQSPFYIGVTVMMPETDKDGRCLVTDEYGREVPRSPIYLLYTKEQFEELERQKLTSQFKKPLVAKALLKEILGFDPPRRMPPLSRENFGWAKTKTLSQDLIGAF